MNAPPRYELFIVPDGVKKVSMKKDTKIPNAATFEIQREDHTIGNMVRMKLLEDKSVLFAGYRMPHPLNPLIEVKVQTRPDTSPLNAFDKALVSLIQDASSINDDFQSEIARIKSGESGNTWDNLR